MALSDEFGHNYSQEQIDQYGKTLLDQYGIEACEAASILDNLDITADTASSYKPQVRQVLSEHNNVNPTPRSAAECISDADKKSSSKSLMVSAMEKYYKAIDESGKAEKLRTIAKNEGIVEKDFSVESDISGWITKEEVMQIHDDILPDKGERINRLTFSDKSWAITYEHRALVMTLYYTACRVGEICKRDSDDNGLTVEDIDMEKNSVEVYRLKKGGRGYKRDIIAVPQDFIDIIQDYIDIKGIDSGILFDFTTRTAQNRIKDIDKAYKHVYGGYKNMDTLTPHKFRHGRITDIANNSSLEDAGQYVDHASPKTTNQYRHLGAEEQRDILPEEDGSNDDKLSELMDKLDADSIDDALDKLDD